MPSVTGTVLNNTIACFKHDLSSVIELQHDLAEDDDIEVDFRRDVIQASRFQSRTNLRTAW
jgi:hypothetical protein